MKDLDSATTYTMLPAMCLGKLEPQLKERGIGYEQLYGPRIPEHIPERCTFLGREYTSHLVCIASSMEPEELIRIAEGLYSR